MRILYDSLASKFDHDAVIVTFYPSNDFKDLDYANRKVNYPDRYKVYSVRNENGVFETKYYLETPEQSAYHPTKVNKGTLRTLVSKIIRSDTSFGIKLYTLFKDLTFTGALVNSAYERIKVKDSQDIVVPNGKYILEEFDATIWEILTYELKRLKESTKSKPLVLVFIPNSYDFEYRSSIDKPSLVQQKIQATCDSLNMLYVDLLETMPSKNHKSYYLKYDDHFDDYGSEVANKILIKKLKEFNVMQKE